MIAYEKKLPDAAAFYELADGTPDAKKRYKHCLQSGSSIVAAYDGEKLVGVDIGGSVTVHPAYINRDIEHNMKKLAAW